MIEQEEGTDRNIVKKPKEFEGFLNPDEFFARMWVSGLRYGIDMEQVKNIITKKTYGSFTIAKWKEPEKGKDAIKERIVDLERKTGVKILGSGKADLRTYEQYLIQTKANQPLYRKIPRQDGKSGFDVRGKRKDPEIPKDIDLLKFCSLGTYIKDIQ